MVTGLNKVTLHDNPWICDCGMLNAVDELDKDGDLVLWLKRIVEQR